LVFTFDFLPFYAILRAIPSKLGGVSAMLGSLVIISILPRQHSANSVYTLVVTSFMVLIVLLEVSYGILEWSY
jgi:quinol-cytochrome oxidoreductase complex cytochrome b subunit